MTVHEIVEVLSKFPTESDVEVLYPEDNYGVDAGVCIDEIAYITGTRKVKDGVYIKLG